MTNVYLIYPYGERISTPDAIGRKLGEQLREVGYTVIQHNFDERRTLLPGPDSVLLGHPHPDPQTIFRRSARQSGWRRVLALAPFNTDPAQVSHLDQVLPGCDLYLAITGNYWYNLVERSLFAHWRPRMVHLDLAVDRRDFPVVKGDFNLPQQRRFLYIGHSGWQKNTAYLSRLAARLPEYAWAWMGGGRPIAGFQALGLQDFSAGDARRAVAQFDFMITVGRRDANPTTVLEAMAWGLVPICTPQSGYQDHPGITNIPLDDPAGAEAILRRLQAAPDEELRALQQINWTALDCHFNWQRFARQVIEAIESDISPPLGPESAWHRGRLRWAALTSPYSPVSPRNLARRMLERYPVLGRVYRRLR